GAYRSKIKEKEAELAALQSDPLALRVAELNPQVDALQKEIQAAEKEQKDAEGLKITLAPLIRQRDQANKQLQDKTTKKRSELRFLQRPGLPPEVPGAYAVSEGKPAEVHIHLKGDPDTPGPVA